MHTSLHTVHLLATPQAIKTIYHTLIRHDYLPIDDRHAGRKGHFRPTNCVYHRHKTVANRPVWLTNNSSVNQWLTRPPHPTPTRQHNWLHLRPGCCQQPFSLVQKDRKLFISTMFAVTSSIHLLIKRIIPIDVLNQCSPRLIKPPWTFEGFNSNTNHNQTANEDKSIE